MRQSRRIMIVCALLATMAGAARAQIVNPSFEAGFGVPMGWTQVAPVVVTQFIPDTGMPTDGTNFVILNTIITTGGVPHSNPGGLGTDATATSALFQTFNITNPSNTTLEFDCMLLSNGVSGDFLEASVSDGVNTLNLVHLDNSDLTATVSLGGFSTSALTHVAVDIAPFFPSANLATSFTVTIHGGNNSLTSPRAHFDDFRLTPGIGFVVASTEIVPHPSIPNFQLLRINTPQGPRRYYHLFSLDVSQPLGSGVLLGLQPDSTIFTILQLPLGVPGIHDITDANGAFETGIPNFLNPTGFTFDHMLVVLNPFGTAVEEISAIDRFVWP